MLWIMVDKASRETSFTYTPRTIQEQSLLSFLLPVEAPLHSVITTVDYFLFAIADMIFVYIVGRDIFFHHFIIHDC